MSQATPVAAEAPDPGTEHEEDLRAAIDRAIDTIARLAHERRQLEQQLQALRDRVTKLESSRRQDRDRMVRLELMEQERDAVRERLTALLDRLEEAGRAE